MKSKNIKKALLLNKKAGDPKNKPEEIISALELKPGDVIADIGAGGGYFSIRFAEIVGKNGKVYAIDINPEFLKFIKEYAQEKNLANIITILAKDANLDLSENILDLIFMRNVTHHLSNRVDYFANLKKYLKPDGKVAIIEHKKGSLFSFHTLFGHYLPKEKIIKEMRAAGYLLLKEFNFLENQHFTLYIKK